MVLDFVHGDFGGVAVEVEDADGAAAGGGAADGHLADVDRVVAKTGPYRPDAARDVVVQVDQHDAVQIAPQPLVPHAHAATPKPATPPSR